MTKHFPRFFPLLSILIASAPAGRCLADEHRPAAPATQPATRPAAPAAGAAAGAARKIDLDEFDKLRGEKGHVVLDVRTPEEFAAGHVPGAVNVPVQSPDFDEKAGALDKGKSYLVHCARGGRSAQAVARMHRIGFEDLADFSGGMEAWKKAGKPTTKESPK